MPMTSQIGLAGMRLHGRDGLEIKVPTFEHGPAVPIAIASDPTAKDRVAYAIAARAVRACLDGRLTEDRVTMPTDLAGVDTDPGPVDPDYSLAIVAVTQWLVEDGFAAAEMVAAACRLAEQRAGGAR